MKNLYPLLFLIVLSSCAKSSKEDVILPTQKVPNAPANLKISIVSVGQIDLTWNDSSTNETGFRIERKTDSTEYSEIATTTQDVANFSDKNVQINTTYSYRVYSYNQAGKSNQSSNELIIKTWNIPTLTTNVITDVRISGAKSGGNVSSIGGVRDLIARGVVWGTNSNPTVALSTKTIEGNGTMFPGSSVPGSGIGTYSSNILASKEGTKYYLRAYATNIVGTAYGQEISFTTNVFTFNTVIGANNRVWMDRNLGAERVAINKTDEASYGDLYQWGRGKDGHQIRTSSKTNILSITDTPGHDLFIPEFDWRNPPNNNLWQGVSGINNACPIGFRLPTTEEWNTELSSWSSASPEGAFASALKLPLAGNRGIWHYGLDFIGVGGYYWSSSIVTNDKSGIYSYYLAVTETTTLSIYTSRGFGMSVRCIKE